MTTVSPPMIKMTRIESFSAAHRLHSVKLNDDENSLLYGKCNHKAGHGHNYRVEVTLQGPVDPVTGMVVNMVDLKMAIGTVLEPLDHKNIDNDVPYFREIVSTAENISIYIWNELLETSLLKGKHLLYKVKLYETDKNVVSFQGFQSE